MKNNPLVSVCIITYNSADFIIEALESVAAQTYNNIELIVSDDASKDNTVELCNNWMIINRDRFIYAEVLTVDNNTGVSANANRAIKKGCGEWIKLFAGDDKLLPNCIEDNLNYIRKMSRTDLLFSDMFLFGGNEKGNCISSPSVFFEHLSEKEFKMHLLLWNFLPAPSCFLKRSVYEELGGYDEKIPMMEDKPFYVKAISANKHFSYMKVPTVCYRISDNSISQISGERKQNRFEESRRQTYLLCLKEAKKMGYLFWLFLKTEYNWRYLPSIKHNIIRGLRFGNPFFYYWQYIQIKVKLFKRMKKY